ncbi:MAG TPA: PAS domain-containing protein, partial [Chthonomonadaceae bacterium]|nr:PAS domain-containing protein [Chthonomonadaceae bacterium]
MLHHTNNERKALIQFTALFALLIALSAVDCCVTPPKALAVAIPLRAARFGALIALGFSILRLRSARSDADRKMSQTLEGVSDAFFWLDGQWRFQYVNAAAEQLLVRQRSELLGRSLWDIYPDAVGSTFELHYRQALAEQTTVTFENYDSDRDKWYALRAHPTADGLAVFCHDVTEAKGASLANATMLAALRESEERLANAQRVARVGSWEFDIASGKIHWSAELFRQFGRDPALGEPDYDTLLTYYHPADVDIVNAHVQSALIDGAAYSHDVRSAPDENGDVRWFHAIATPVRDETGAVVRLVGTKMDVTERVAAERAQAMLTAIL